MVNNNFKQNTEKCQSILLKTTRLLETVGLPKKGNGRYILIPLHGKTPIKGFPLQELYDGKEVEVDYESINTSSFGIPTGFYNLVVVDFDDDTLYERFRDEYSEFTNTFTVKTRRGHHLYYLADGFLAQKILKLDKIDVKCGRSYIVAPYSVVDGYEYTVEKSLPIQRITIKSYEKLLKALEEISKKTLHVISEEQKKETDTSIDDYYGFVKLEPAEEGLIEKIIDVVLPHYTEGQRQDLVLALCGFLLKHHIRPVVIKKLIEELHKKGNDTDSLSQRLSALKSSYNKPVNELVGASKLKQSS